MLRESKLTGSSLLPFGQVPAIDSTNLFFFFFFSFSDKPIATYEYYYSVLAQRCLGLCEAGIPDGYPL